MEIIVENDYYVIKTQIFMEAYKGKSDAKIALQKIFGVCTNDFYNFMLSLCYKKNVKPIDKYCKNDRLHLKKVDVKEVLNLF